MAFIGRPWIDFVAVNWRLKQYHAFALQTVPNNC